MWRTNCRRGKTMNITYVNRDKKTNAAITGAGRVLALTSRNCRKSKNKAKAISSSADSKVPHSGNPSSEYRTNSHLVWQDVALLCLGQWQSQVGSETARMYATWAVTMAANAHFIPQTKRWPTSKIRMLSNYKYSCQTAPLLYSYAVHQLGHKRNAQFIATSVL